MGSVFTAIVAFLWPLAALYGFEYMEHEGGENHFFALYTVTYGVTLGISTAANILTLYFFYEFLTLCTLPLVMHGTQKPSEHAGYTYMLYSFFGAALAFIGVMLVLNYGDGGAFTMGGVMAQAAAEHPTMVQLGYLCAFLGFGVKAAVFPGHRWLLRRRASRCCWRARRSFTDRRWPSRSITSSAAWRIPPCRTCLTSCWRRA